DRKSEKSALYAAGREELAGDPVDGGGGNGKRQGAGQARRVDSEDAAAGFPERAAGESVVDRQVQAEEAGDLAARPSPPFTGAGADDPEARGQMRAGSAEGEDQAANLVIGLSRGFDGRHCRVVEAEDGQIGGGVSTGERRRRRAAAREGDGDVVIAGDRMARCDDDAGLPDDA